MDEKGHLIKELVMMLDLALEQRGLSDHHVALFIVAPSDTEEHGYMQSFGTTMDPALCKAALMVQVDRLTAGKPPDEAMIVDRSNTSKH